MKLLKSKKGDVGEASGVTLIKVVTWLLLIALIVFAIFWYSNLGNYIIKLGKSFLK